MTVFGEPTSAIKKGSLENQIEKTNFYILHHDFSFIHSLYYKNSNRLFILIINYIILDYWIDN